ncbi:hypothetical protein ROLI_019820 [Roseobacter fucihabitans]|uniref:Translation initiation factor 3 n=1 Tax=Roseobacter fucihabitans TaxID=1537242 RepID=A0ABZ2BS89_9RHOB|nr:translation initiation factor 3 [Roseobacter litoralis]MBC6966196.1 hypothetical protein [Roseobacter litoralis]
MKNLIWVLVAAVILGGGYYLISGQRVDEAVREVITTEPDTDTAQAVPEVDDTAAQAEVVLDNAASDASGTVESTAEDIATAAGDAVEDAVETMADVVDEATAAVSQAADEAAEQAADLAQEATAATEEAATTAGEALTEMVQDASEAGENLLSDATPDAATDTPAVAEQSAPTRESLAAVDDVKEAEALTVAGFDLAKVNEMIENSDLATTQKLVLSNAVKSAQDNPALLEAALTQLRNALGGQ